MNTDYVVSAEEAWERAQEARAEARAERDDFDGFETARNEDRYLTGFGWDR